jgi:hypothetical protein
MAADDREIWFPAKRYGWGWALPCAWQGWVVIGMYAVMLVIGWIAIDPQRDAAMFTGWVLGWTALLGVATWLKGERPRWRWGDRGRG